MKQNKENRVAKLKKWPLLVFRCLALGLGIGVLVLSGMHEIETEEGLWLLALAVTCLAACPLGDTGKDEQNR